MPLIYFGHIGLIGISEGGYNAGHTAGAVGPSVQAVNPRTEFGLAGGRYSSTVPDVYRAIQPRTMELVDIRVLEHVILALE